MGGKGVRRREKNFLAAHGGNNRLPPPPKMKEMDPLPSKLRKLMQYMNNPSVDRRPTHFFPSVDRRSGQGRESGGAEKKGNTKDAQEFNLERGIDISKTTSRKDASEIATVAHSCSDDTTKKKKKRKAVTDLRFQDLDQAAVGSRKKVRRKEYLELKKQKQKKQKADDFQDFLGREEIKFGDVVEAPPKLSFPKVRKSSMDASKERIRLQAVEAYRNRRGWMSRPGGVQLPSLAETSSS